MEENKNSIRIKKDNVYRIEVNDKGECIEFDLLDIDLPFKFFNCGEKLQQKQEEYYENATNLREKYQNEPEELLKAMHELDNNFCNELRQVFDELLGENACQKIFGSTNRVGMFNDLFDKLEPHFEKLKLKHDDIQKELFNKYKNIENDVI